MTMDEKTTVTRSVLLDALELLPRNPGAHLEGWLYPSTEQGKAIQLLAARQCSGRGQRQEAPQSMYKDVCSPRGFPLLTKNIRSNLHQQRRRDGEAREQREKIITTTLLKYDQSWLRLRRV